MTATATRPDGARAPIISVHPDDDAYGRHVVIMAGASGTIVLAVGSDRPDISGQMVVLGPADADLIAGYLSGMAASIRRDIARR